MHPHCFFSEGVSTGALTSSYVGGGGEDLQGLLGGELGGGSDTRRASFESVWWGRLLRRSVT